MELSIKSTVLLNNGIKFPIFGFGTYKIQDPKEIDISLKSAIEAGYLHIDTASLYRNEEHIGEVLKELFSSGKVKREDLFITSKLNSQEQGHEKALEAFNRSIKSLGIDYLDLYLIHWPGARNLSNDSEENSKLRFESWQVLEKLYSEKKCRAIGVSNYTQKHLQELLLKCKVKPQVNQVEFHPFLYQKDLLDYCNSNDIVLEAYSSLVRYADFAINNKTLIGIANAHNKSISQILLRWAIQHGVPVIPKSITPQRIVENTDIFNFKLSDDEMQQMNSLNINKRVCLDPNKIL